MTLFSTAYFPSIRYMARFLFEEAPEIEIWETYHKQTCRNRCFVMTANGVEVMSVPVKKVNGNHTMTKDVLISEVEPWQQVHRRCLESAYKASPYFDHYFTQLAPIFNTRHESLIELNDTALRSILKILKVQKEIVHTTDYHHEVENDLRTEFLKRTSAAMPSYYQVFSDKFPFAPDLSILDLVFNVGPESLKYLKSIMIQL